MAIDIPKYNDLIDQAESYILEEKFKKALKLYNKSFNYIDKPLGVDCYNALLSALYSNDYQNVNFWAKKLISKGVHLKFFNSEIFSEFRKSRHWTTLQKEFHQNYNIFLSSKESYLIDKLEFLTLKDQEKYCGIPNGESTNNEAFELTHSISKEVEILLNKYGFFTEEKIGLNIKNDTILLFYPKFYALARHNFQSTTSNNLFSKSLIEAVKKGQIKKQFLESINDEPMSDPIVKIGENFYRKKSISSEDRNYNDSKKRIFFYQKNKNLRFQLPPSFSVLNFKDKQNEQSFIENNLTLINPD